MQGWIQIAPGVFIPPWLAGRCPITLLSSRRRTIKQQLQAAAAQQAANAAAARQNALQAEYRQRTANSRATANAAVTSLRILGQGPNPVARGAQTSRRDEEKEEAHDRFTANRWDRLCAGHRPQHHWLIMSCKSSTTTCSSPGITG